MNNTNDNTTNKKLLTVLFRNPSDADKAFDYLISEGFNRDDITVIMSNETRDKNFKDIDMPEDSLGSKAVEGMGVGGAIGGTIGAIAAAIAAIGTSLILPGLGLVVAGPIAAALAGAGAGSAVGGIVGALVGSGISDEQAKQYEKDIKSGSILIGVDVQTEKYDEFENKLIGLNSYV
jgi:hypothetical protein